MCADDILSMNYMELKDEPLNYLHNNLQPEVIILSNIKQLYNYSFNKLISFNEINNYKIIHIKAINSNSTYFKIVKEFKDTTELKVTDFKEPES